ncbi:MAG: low specificity L-threonine aldolase [Rhodospirillales bacterium CG15_BIG_FIL_POST_REV_8_21_14_020_66_15]|nr:MAG: low specificity L-threonine aldolase [Rhodospirillales bacterium CG15_BIG_FIL_POST_REV_8_21_14_020_66_15]
MNFASDNTAGAHPDIMAAIMRANEGRTMPYGHDAETEKARRRVCEVFETDAKVFFVPTGTAANGLAVASVTPSWGAVVCHETAHIFDHEGNGPVMYSGGARLIGLPGADGRITAKDVEAATLEGRGDEHYSQVRAVSITQLTEKGTAYRIDEIAAIGEVCRKHGLSLHMDGARFANALARLNCSPADMSWKAGVDVLSFGGTKNGALALEAVVVFNPALGDEFLYRQKRAGHVLSKMRLMTAQMEAYLAGDLWLRNARHSNAMARRLAEGLKALGVEITGAVDGNQVFPRLPAAMAEALKTKGFLFYDRGPDDQGRRKVRLVTAFDTPEDDVDAFLETAATAVL